MYRLDGEIDNEPLAHSPKPPTSEQTYKEHIEHVLCGALSNARAASRYYSGNKDAFVQAVEAAALYHDLGKLDKANQDVLHRTGREKLPLPHEDAGVAELLQQNHYEAAILAAAHHAGIFSAEKEQKKGNRLLRNLSERDVQGKRVVVAEYVDINLDGYQQKHKIAGIPKLLAQIGKQSIHSCGFMRRVALSCLVDADHGDTARHYGKEASIVPVPLRWEERLSALDKYIGELPQTSARDALRREMYLACRDADTDVSLKACDAPVGTGKTTAVMANLLRAAVQRRLRHIIVVLPYTNIIKQAIDVYRNALTLPGENPEDVVAEHHHRADFSNVELRQLATLWKAPIIVTTAVQFFETLGASHPSHLRKLHELPGSAVFVDEMHTALPSPLWPQVWQWLQIWTERWGGYLVMASGSLPRFWESKEFVSEPTAVPDLLPGRLRKRLVSAEGARIRYASKEKLLNPDELVEFILEEKRGPRLLIMNTVQSTAYIANKLRKEGQDVMHLSTALAPAHRERIVDLVKERLNSSRKDWTLVATSCVEAGMDFSFRRGFRERSTTASLIQVGGRVSRGAEYDEAVVWDFRAEGGLLTQNPSLELPRKVVQRMFESERINELPPSELAKQAMLAELTEQGKEDADSLKEAESTMNYPAVSELCRVIKTDTRLVVISDTIAERIRGGERVNSQELLRFSVQMWSQKIEKGDLPLGLLLGSPNEADSIYFWEAEYDPDFLGYMAGGLPILEGIQAGVFFV